MVSNFSVVTSFSIVRNVSVVSNVCIVALEVAFTIFLLFFLKDTVLLCK